MALDYISNVDIPYQYDFKVSKEPTKFKGESYVVNEYDGEYLGIVGDNYALTSHGEYFNKVWSVAEETLGRENCLLAEKRWRSARNGAFVMLDAIFKDGSITITTADDTHQTELFKRMVALHGVDGKCSNQVFYGLIDMFCTNGTVTGDHNYLKKKNTALFNVDIFQGEIADSVVNFEGEAEKIQTWASINTRALCVKSVLDYMMGNEKKADKMLALYREETRKRGENLFALYSAFTNYATYGDERNGFTVRNTGNDTKAVTMWKREQEVAKWVDSPVWNDLVNSSFDSKVTGKWGKAYA